MNFHGVQASSPAKEGATCYLKSVLRVLFKTEDFREAVRHSSENHGTEFIDHHLKTFFEDDAATADEIIKTLDIVDVYEQRDAAEYFERILKLTSPQASRIFRGMLTNKASCSKCHTETDREAPFWHLPLALVNSCTDTRGREVYRVVDGIEEFFRPTELNGENQMYCDRCGHKVDATITDVIKYHPDVLILLLKRVEFNYHYMSYVKTSCSVEVPYSLQLPESQTYELYAVVDHLGDLRGGHYTATIRIQEEHEDTWCEFNDTRVTPLDYQPFQVDNTEKSESAYLLFYRKKYAATEEVKKTHTSGCFSPFNTDISDQRQDVGKEAEVLKNDAIEFFVIKNEGTLTGEKRLLFKNTPLQEDVKGHENVQGHLNKQDEMVNGQKRLMDLIPEKDEQTEKKDESLTKRSDNHIDYQGDQGSHNVTLSAHKGVGVETQTRDGRDDGGEKKGADKYAQRSKITTEKPDHSEAVKRKSMRLDDAGHTATKNSISVTRTSQSVGGVEIQRKEQQNEGDHKQNQSEGNKALKGRLTEKQGGDCDENIRLERFQPKAGTVILKVTEEGGSSNKSSLLVKVVDEEHTEIPCAHEHSNKSKTVIRKIRDETVQDATKWLESQRNIKKYFNI